jgi:hypothetical protein
MLLSKFLCLQKFWARKVQVRHRLITESSVICFSLIAVFSEIMPAGWMDRAEFFEDFIALMKTS